MHPLLYLLCCIPIHEKESSSFHDKEDSDSPPRLIVTPSIHLAPLSSRDINAITTHLNDPRIYSTLHGIPRPYTRRHAAAWVTDAHRAALDNGGLPLVWSIRLTATDEHVGCVTLSEWSAARPSFAPTRASTPVPFADHDQEPLSLGYYLDSRFWGYGVTPLCVWAVMQTVAARGMDRGRFRVPVYYGNMRSRRVLEKCGFVLVKEEKGMWLDREGRTFDGWIFEARVA